MNNAIKQKIFLEALIVTHHPTS